MGLFNTLFGGGKETVTTGVDPVTAARQKEVWERSQQVANQPYNQYQGQSVAGVSDLSTGGAQHFQDAMRANQYGAAAMGGDAAAMGRFFNPFEQGVIDQTSQQYDRLRNQAALGSNDAATAGGGFGGDRHALMVGERQGALDRGEGETLAQLRYQGWNDAQNQANISANFGMGAANQAFNAGDYFRNVQQQGLTNAENKFNEARDWDQGRLGILQSGVGTPGTSTTQPKKGGGLFGGLLGAAATIGGGLLGGPVGAKVGNAVAGSGGSDAMYGQTPGTSYYG